jgi:hypothetical protein
MTLVDRRALLALMVTGLLVAAELTRAQPARPAVPGHTIEDSSLISAVYDNLKRERQLLLEYVYRERRRPVQVSPLGRVSLGDEQTLDVFPSSDPDRPRRMLVAVNGRPATQAERDKFLEDRQASASRRERDRREAETRRRAQERLDDAFRVYLFVPDGQEEVEGRLTQVVRVVPRPGVDTRSDVGKWLTRFAGRVWVDTTLQELVKVEMVATDTISLGWGVVGRISEGTKVTYLRRPVDGGLWFPAAVRYEARGRTLIFRSFQLDSTTEWFDYRPAAASSRAAASPR